MKEIRREYKQGEKKNFYLRENNGTFFFDKITKACGFTLKAGTEKEVTDYIKANNYEFVGLIVL